MRRKVAVLGVALAATLIARPQGETPQEEMAGDPYEGLRRVMAVKQKEWSQTHNSLVDASRKMSPCSPRLSALLQTARKLADDAVKANGKYFERWGENLRQQIEEGRRFAAEAATNLDNTKVLMESAEKEGDVIQKKRADLEAALKETNSKDLRESIENLERIYATNRKNLEEAMVSGGKAAELIRVTREQLGVQEALLKQIQGYEQVEFRKWQNYYDAMEADLRRRCTTSQRPSDPLNIPTMSVPAPAAKAGKQ